MRTPISRPLLPVFSLLAALSLPQSLPAQYVGAPGIIPYIGGGLRMGYVVDEGLSLGAEVTLGVGIIPGIFSSIALGIQTMPTAPRQLSYVSWSGSVFGLLGIAVGKTYYSLDGRNYAGTRRIVYAVLPLAEPGDDAFVVSMVSWESYRFPNLHTQKKALGLWGRLALTLIDI